MASSCGVPPPSKHVRVEINAVRPADGASDPVDRHRRESPAANFEVVIGHRPSALVAATGFCGGQRVRRNAARTPPSHSIESRVIGSTHN